MWMISLENTLEWNDVDSRLENLESSFLQQFITKKVERGREGVKCIEVETRKRSLILRGNRR